MQRAYIDESGYTGGDLLNAEQPFFALSALFITEDQASSLRRKYFPKLQAPELKHVTQAKKPNHWDSLLKIQQECLSKYCGISYIAEKRYMCILKLLNDCIEPVWHSNGRDFYRDGHNLQLASCLYYCGPHFFGQESFNRLLSLYQQASRSKKSEDIDAFCKHAQTLIGKELGDVFWPIADRHPAFLEEISSPLTNTNIASAMLSGLINKLEDRSIESYSLTHDTSPAMCDFHTTLQALMQIDSPISFRISDVAHSSYPLKLKSIEEADSKVSTGVQIADLLAGGLVEGFKEKNQIVRANAYNTKVLKLYSDSNFMHMFPTTDLRDLAASFKGTQMASAINFVSSSHK